MFIVEEVTVVGSGIRIIQEFRLFIHVDLFIDLHVCSIVSVITKSRYLHRNIYGIFIM